MLAKARKRVDLDSNNHSVFKLYYHLILVVKYRRKVLNDEISSELEAIFVRIGEHYGITVEEWNHDIDHVHVMFRAKPNTNMSKFLNSYKSASSRLIKKQYPQIRKYLWKEMFWARSYCLLTAGGAPLSVLKEYIRGQGENRS